MFILIWTNYAFVILQLCFAPTATNLSTHVTIIIWYICDSSIPFGITSTKISQPRSLFAVHTKSTTKTISTCYISQNETIKICRCAFICLSYIPIPNHGAQSLCYRSFSFQFWFPYNTQQIYRADLAISMFCCWNILHDF